MIRRILRLNPFLRLVLIVVISIIPSALFSCLVIYPLHKNLKSSLEELEKKKEELQRLRAIAMNYKSAKQEFERLKKELARMEIMLPSNPDVPSFLEKISFLSKKYKVSADSLLFSPEKREKDYSFLPVSLTICGPFHSIALFLSDLSQWKRVVGLDDFLFSGKGMNVKARCSLKLYFMRKSK